MSNPLEGRSRALMYTLILSKRCDDHRQQEISPRLRITSKLCLGGNNMTSESAQQEDIATICKGLVDEHIQFVRNHRPA